MRIPSRHDRTDRVRQRHRLPPYTRSLKTTGDGYGDKLPTEYQVQLNGSTVWRNVWAVCWSNAASLYVITAGNRRYIRESTFDTARDERPRK